MKNILMLIIPLAALLTGCRRDYSAESAREGNGELTVVFNIPEVRAATRAPITDGMIQSLWVMVFNENGNYISRYRGEPVTNDLSKYTFLNVPLSTAARTLHFVANFDWNGFRDRDLIGVSENEVLGGMSVAGGTVAYWQRVELPDGLDVTPGTVMTLNETVHLLRNVAEISVINSTSEGGNSLSLTDVEFAVGDYFDKGSVAPFNTLTGDFGTGNKDVDTPASDFITEAISGNTVDIDAGDFVYAQNDLSTPSEAIEIYERRNSTASEQTYVIVRGKFQDGITPNETVWSYYKIDICEDDATRLLDLRRNFRYKIDLRLVSHAGYSTLEEAVLNAAVNNINASITVSEYTAVSDGANVLRIEHSSFIYVRTGQPFEIRYSYIEMDGSSGATNNTGISITLDQDENRPVVADESFGYDIASTPWTGGRSGAIIRGITAPNLPENNIYRARINISKGMLSREIELQLRPAMNFIDVGTTPEDGIVHNSIGEHASISFKMPVDISPSLFPIPVYITTKRFSPDASKGQLSVDVNAGSSDYEFRYVYYAPYLVDAGNQPLPHTVYLVSNSPNTDETVTLSADMFNDAYVQFGNGTLPAIGNLTAAPNGNALAAQVGIPVTLSFDVPAGGGQTAPYTFRIFTSKLNFVSTATPGADCVWDPQTECYVYTTPGAGPQSINFSTNSADSRETVRVTGTGFSSATFARTCNLLNFINAGYSPASVQRAVGTPVNISFGIPQEFDWNANGGECIVSFYTRSLEPLDESQPLVETSDIRYGTGYRMTVTEAEATGGVFTARFRTLYANTDIRTTIDSPGFNTVDLTATRTNWNFTASFSTKPRDINNNTTTTTLTFTLPPGSASPDAPVEITFVAPYLALVANDDANRSPELAGGNISSTGTSEDVVMTMTLDTPGTYHFRVRNATTGNGNQPRTQRQTVKRLQATYFNDKTLNNQNGD